MVEIMRGNAGRSIDRERMKEKAGDRYQALKTKGLLTMEISETRGADETLGTILFCQFNYQQAKLAPEFINGDSDWAEKKITEIEFYWRGLVDKARELGDEDVAVEIEETFLDTHFGTEEEVRVNITQ